MIRWRILTSVIFITTLFLLSNRKANGQGQLTKIKSWKGKEIEQASVDRLGNFLLVDKKGEIKKYDPDGKVMASISMSNITLFEPWYHPSIFIYQRATQKYFSYGRYFESVKELSVPAEFAIEPFLICPTHDNRLWILDKADYSLKKINPLSGKIENEFILPVESNSPAFVFLRDYQNLIFLSEKNAIWIINTLGNVINKIESDQLRNFGFFGQELYYLQDNIVYFYDLLTEARYTLPLEGQLKFALVTDERVLTVSTDNQVTLYQYTP